MTKAWKSCMVVLGSFVAMAGTAAGLPQAAATQQETQQKAEQQAPSQTPPQPAPASPAEAARRLREQKKDQIKTARVWDNDNLPKTGAPAPASSESSSTATPSSPEGPASNASASTAQPANSAAPAPPTEQMSAKEKAQLDAAVAEAKEKIDDLKKDLDIAQRKFALDSDTYYGKPNYAADPAGKSALDAETAAIADLKQQVQQAEQLLAEMQAKLGVTLPKN